MPLISIIVPVYNTEEFLEKCIESILNQGIAEFELILIIDGSTDKSEDICRKYALIDKRIRVLRQNNKGVSSARNTGLDVARGDYFCFVDSDDWLGQGFLSEGIKTIKKEKCDMFCCGYYYETPESRPRSIAISTNISKMAAELNEHDYIELLSNNYIASSCAIIYSKRCLKNRFNPSVSFGEDLQFVFDCLTNNPRIYATNDCYYHYVLNQRSAVHTINDSKVRGVLSTYTYLFKFSRSQFPEKDMFYNYVKRRWEKDYYYCLQQIKQHDYRSQIRLLKLLNSKKELTRMLRNTDDKYIKRYGLHPLVFVLYNLINERRKR